MKTIMLPLWVEKHAHEHASNHAEHECGLSDPNSSDYQRAYKHAFKKFCLEYYEHSLIPAETEDSVRGNPYAQPATAAFRNFAPAKKQRLGDPSSDQFFAYFFNSPQSKIPPEDREKAIRRFKGAVQTIERLFLDVKYGPVTDTNALRIYDHQKTNLVDFKTRGGKLVGGREVQSKRSLAKLNYRDVIINRYVRLFVATMVLASIRNAYSSSGKDIVKAVNQALARVPAGDLNRKKNTDAFAKAVFEAIRRSTMDITPAKYAIDGILGASYDISTKGIPEQLAAGKAKKEQTINEQSQFPQEAPTLVPSESQEPYDLPDSGLSEDDAAVEAAAEKYLSKNEESEMMKEYADQEFPVQDVMPEKPRVKIEARTKTQIKAIISAAVIDAIKQIREKYKKKKIKKLDAQEEVVALLRDQLLANYLTDDIVQFAQRHLKGLKADYKKVMVKGSPEDQEKVRARAAVAGAVAIMGRLAPELKK